MRLCLVPRPVRRCAGMLVLVGLVVPAAPAAGVLEWLFPRPELRVVTVTDTTPAERARSSSVRKLVSVCCSTPGMPIISLGADNPSRTNIGCIKFAGVSETSATNSRIAAVARSLLGL